MQPKIHYIDPENTDLADAIVNAIEKDYGRSIERIPRFERYPNENKFHITIIFTDFTLFDAEILIVGDPGTGLAHIEIHGAYW